MESTLTTEQLLAQNPRWSYDRTDRNKTRYFLDCTCDRCGGHGGWRGWPGFTCYECGGSGVSTPKVVKVYTPEYAAKLAAQRQARAEKAQKEREMKAIAERGANLKKAGFGEESGEYVIYRVVGNTFEIKDDLKAAGAKFKPCVGWYFPENKEEYECQRMTESEVLIDSIYIEWKNKADVEVNWLENTRRAEESVSEWQGVVGERIQVSVHIDRAFESQFTYGPGAWGSTTSYMYLMTDINGNKYKWSTSKFYKEGIDITLNGTVKDHAEYKGIKQTVLTRCREVK